MRFGFVTAAALALTACAPDSSKSVAEVAQVARTYVESNDINASLGILEAAPTTTSITGQGRVVRGPAIRDEANKQIARLPHLKVTAGNIQITQLGNAHMLAVVPFGISPSATPDKPTTEGAATLVLAKRDSGWKVIHEHFSAVAKP